MGQRGPAPKPTTLKLLCGTPGKRPLNSSEPDPGVGAPPCPDWLSDEAKAKWQELLPELEACGLLTKLDGDALARYCWAWRASGGRPRRPIVRMPEGYGLRGAGLEWRHGPSRVARSTSNGLFASAQRVNQMFVSWQLGSNVEWRDALDACYDGSGWAHVLRRAVPMGKTPHPYLASDHEANLIERARQHTSEIAEETIVPATQHTANETEALLPGSFPGYEILREVHRGGQGIVYEAVQKSTKRRVAIKVLKEGPVVSAQDRVRFEREIEVLGALSHPHIVTIHDSGSEAGQFYYVMDYIAGQPLDVYVAGGQRSIKATLELCMKVCDAVNAAHLRGVIHRDLKPNNIIVDAEGKPHVLDFGLAKVAMGATTDDARPQVMTVTGQFVGSLPWAAPEQAEGASGKIDVRTDVYSLGVILYQVLTGKFPYEIVGNMRDVLDRIVTAEPLRPSLLRKQIDGEVETIILKCLSKDRDRRYQSAGELARDIRHYLRGEPIEAKRDSTLYVLRKQLNRHKVATGAASSLVVLLTIFAVAMSIQVDRARKARNEAIVAKAEADHQAGIAVLNEQRAKEEALRAAHEADRAHQAEVNAEQRAAELEKVAEFQSTQLSNIDAELMGVRLRLALIAKRRAALEARGADDAEVETRLGQLETSLVGVNFTNVALETLDEIIFEHALKAIEKELTDQPLIQARLQQTVSDTLRHVGLLDRAVSPLEQALRTRRELLGDNHADTLDSIDNMGTLLHAQGKLSEAERYFREALEGRRRTLGDDHADTLLSVINMGVVLEAQGNLPEAERLYREALDGCQRVLGNDHPTTLGSVNNMGHLLQLQGKLSEAQSYYAEALAGYRRVLGDEHLDTLTSMNNVATVLYDQGKLGEAEMLSRESLEGYRRVLGDDHPLTLVSTHNLGALLRAQGKLAEAHDFYRDALTGFRRVLGDDHQHTLTTMNDMGHLLQLQGKFAEAELYSREALEGKRRVLGDNHPDTLVSMNNMGALLRDLGRFAEAEELGAEAVRRARNALPAGHWYTAVFLLNHARTLAAIERFAEAETELLEAHETFVTGLGSDHTWTIKCVKQLAEHYDAWHAAEPDKDHDADAARWRARLAAPGGEEEADSPEPKAPMPESPSKPVDQSSETDETPEGSARTREPSGEPE